MELDRDSIIAEIKKVSDEIYPSRISKPEFKRRSGISEYQILKYFDSWSAAVQAAGLIPIDVSKIDDNSLFQEMRRVFIKNGGISTRTRFDKLCKYSADVYKRRFGRWVDVLSAFNEWLKTSEEDFEYKEQLDKYILHEPPSNENEIRSEGTSYEGSIIVEDRSTVYGDFLNFRGLQHAPINEQGVVFLFGMVCRDLGFIVESIRTSYPDCEAKRAVTGRRGKAWQRVRIEFEYRSSDFKSHGHHLKGCDIIVCWIDDWPECPLEVLELRAAISKLAGD